MGRNYQGKHQGYTENRYQVLAEDRQSRYFVPNSVFLWELKMKPQTCAGVAIMAMEEEDVTTTTNTTIVTGMEGHQLTVGEVLATGFGAGEALFTIGLDHVR